MRCPSLKDLPPPPSGKTGWPWTVESTQLPESMPDGKPWPKISIVTPSFNQGQFIEETIRSILLQGYPDLEYVIIDGASTDDSVKIIKKYEFWLAYWLSECDDGQADAINKGVARITGKIFNWINSDDYIEIGSLAIIANNMPENGLCAFAVREFGFEWERIDVSRNLDIRSILITRNDTVFRQPALWIATSLVEKTFPLDIDLHYAFDWKMLIYLVLNEPIINYSNTVVVNFRHHNSSKTVSHSEEWLFDGIKIRQDLIKDHALIGYHKYITNDVKKIYWHSKVDELRDHGTIFSAIFLAILILMNPLVRFDKYSLGAIKSIFLNCAVYSNKFKKKHISKL